MRHTKIMLELVIYSIVFCNLVLDLFFAQSGIYFYL